MKANSPSDPVRGLALPDPLTVARPEDPYDLLSDYVDSVNSLLEELEEAALAYEQGQDPDPQAATIRRVLHKLKGEAGMVGFDALNKAFHEAENAFEQLPQAHRADMLLRLRDWVCLVLQQMVAR